MNISFALTTRQIREQIKTETRRDGWIKLVGICACGGQPILQPIVKGMGLKKGEHVEKINGPIRVLKAWREPLNAITKAACIREGFPHMTPEQFVAMYVKHNGGKPDKLVTVIQFEYP